MKSKLNLLVVWVAFLAVNCYAQDFSLSELISLQGKNLEYINNYLSKKKWEFHSSNVEESEGFENYTTIGWSLNKNSWDGRADAWFYIYQQSGSEDLVGYQTSKANFAKLKNATTKNGYKIQSTKAVENGLKTIYRNDKLELTFTESVDYDESYYFITVYNYKEIEEQLRAQRELEKKEEEARQKEAEAQRKIELENQAKEEKYRAIISQGDSLFRKKNYTASKLAYEKALEMKPNDRYPTGQINEINDVLVFLKERKTRVYKLQDINKTEYNNVIDLIQKESNAMIKNGSSSSFSISGMMKVEMDTTGVVKFNTEGMKTDNQAQLDMLLTNLTNVVKVEAQYKNGYAVNSDLTYSFDISVQQGTAMFRIDKSNNLIFSDPYPVEKAKSDIENKYRSGDIGKYSVTYEIASNENTPAKSNITLVKYKKPFKFPTYIVGGVLGIAAAVYLAL